MLTLPWFLGVTAGFAVLVAYGSVPGPSESPPDHWPATASIERATDRPTLLVFVHPQCPCTLATIAELERLIAEVSGHVQPIVLLGCPANQRQEWLETRLAQRCQMLSASQVLADVNGVLATQFNAMTSGFCVLYSATGKLQFHGGITYQRGHEGESHGRVALRRILNGQPPLATKAPVYGCQLIRTENRPAPPSPCCQEVEP